jgi:hypothetical protein
MREDRYAKYGASTGIVFVVLLVIGFLIVTPTPPDLDAPVGDWTTYYTDHQDAINTAMVIITVSMIFFLWFLGTLVSALRVAVGSPRLPTIAFAGGLIATTFFIVATTAVAVAAHRPDEISPELTRALNDVGLLAGVPGIAGLIAFFAATGLTLTRTTLMPDWLGWLALVAAAAQLLTFGALFTDTGAFAADGVLGLFIPFGTAIITVLALSIVLVQTVDDLNRDIGITDRVRGAVTGAAVGAQTGVTQGRPPPRT